MVTIVYCTREHNPEHTEHLRKTSGLHKHAQIIEIINNGESLTKCYNRGLEQAENDIVVFCHDDIEMKNNGWAKKLVRHYEKNPEHGILGVAGTKSLSKTGRWWDDKRAMYGRVEHTHQGKSWLSKYSADQGNRIEDTVIVDGVFFSVHKGRIEENFDESVEGFHFYDVDFCFRNYLKGVKVGVHTNIKINHMSIGQTNDQWEENRKAFAEKFEDKLPVKIKETFEYRKLKILLGCLNFAGNTGSEISTLETAKGLAKLGCDVTVTSPNISRRYYMIAKRHGVKVVPLSEPPGYKLGDGEWGMQGPDGNVIPSQKDTLYKISEPDFDVIHANHKPVTERLLELYPHTKFVNIVRSEVIELEDPVVDPRIKKYIAIRPTIKEHLMESFEIDEEKIEVIYNIFDQKKFRPAGSQNNEKKITLFVGTMDYLRRSPIEDLIESAEKEDKIVWLVGKDTDGYAKEFAEEFDHVEYFEETDKIEEFYQKCDETAGIFLGRTTIEGYLCGKPAWIYTVNKSGDVTDKEFHEVPEDMSVFDPEKIVEQLKEVYVEAYNE